jgi:hypothetical protein
MYIYTTLTIGHEGFRMSGRLAVELSKIGQILLGNGISRQMQHGVLQGTGMTIGQDESITGQPIG